MTKLEKILNGGTCPYPTHAITDPFLTELVTKMHNLGFVIDNQHQGVKFELEDWVVFLTKSTGHLQTYYKGYGIYAQTCSINDFEEVDQVILWQEENKSVEVKETGEYQEVQSILDSIFN